MLDMFCWQREQHMRPVQRGQERIKEVAKLGFTHAIVPKANKPKHKIEGIEIFAMECGERSTRTCPAACSADRESERHTSREVVEQAVEYCLD